MTFNCKYIFVILLVVSTLRELRAQHYDICISEILADNENGIKDEDEEREDWIELHNQGTNSVNLRGWWLTDKTTSPDKWEFPEVEIPADGYLLIWASGKDRDNPLMPLHTDFGLSKSGEYLGLYRPDPTNGPPLLVDEYSPEFPPLPEDVSYGVTEMQAVTNLIKSGDVGRYTVLTASQGNAFYFGTDYISGHLGHDQPDGWNVNFAFDDSSWTLAKTGIGYSSTTEYDPWIGASLDSNCRAALYNINSSLCFRKPFVIQDTNAVFELTLKMKYEDGFVAFINGVEVGRANCTNLMAYNTSSDTWLNETIVNSWTEYDIPLDLLQDGTNILAVQGLNAGLTSSDFLLLPELAAILIGDSSYGYYSVATPGEPNGIAITGALLFDAEPADPDIPRPLGGVASPPLTVTVNVIETLDSVAAVRVYTRRMYDAESSPVLLKDDGVDPDVFAGDGVYSASIDTTIVGPGEMLRWRFEAENVVGEITQLPAYIDPLDSAQYFGTVALDSSIATSLLPTFYWFIAHSPDKGPNWSTFRGSCYYLTNFYDNTGHQMHGQSSASFPKHSYDFDFTDEKRFFWKEGERRVKDLNLLSNYADKTKARNTLAHWVGEQCGTPSHFCQTVRVHLNGYFHGVMDMMEDSDDRMTERNGLDPDGALYKIYSTDLVTNVEKKTRKDEDNQDLIDLAAGLSRSKPVVDRQLYAYDNVDVAALVNYLAVRQLTTDSDHGHKNFLMYRDTTNTREWQPIVWDVDLSAGHMWTSTFYYFDDALYYMPPRIPFNRGAGSPVYAVVYEFPEVREMYVRRMRTLMDKFMQPPGTVDGILETKIRKLAALVDPDPAVSTWTDGDLDFARWGIHSNFIQNQPREEVERLVAEYYQDRRDYIFGTDTDRPGVSGTYIPESPQTNTAGMIIISEIKSIPESGLLSEEYLILKNTTDQSVDISGWSIEGCISKTFKGGTVIPAGAGTAADNYIGLLHLAKDALAFRSRSSGPTGGERRFVQGGYTGQMPSAGGNLTLRDEYGTMIFTTNYPAALSPSQESLRVTELNYHPAPPTEAELAQYQWAQDEDFEYIELKNTGSVELNLTGASFTDGIDFTFPSALLAPGERLVVAKNLTAFGLRYPSISVSVYGPYDGALNNSSERLVLIDAGGDQVLDFEYSDDWYELTDGSGRTLVLRTENIATNQYADLFNWNVSWNPLGSPGSGEAAEAHAYHGWDNLKFTESELQDELISGAFSDPDNDGRQNWVEYALGSDPHSSDAAGPISFAWDTSGVDRHVFLSYTKARNTVDVSYALVFSTDLASGGWEPLNYFVSLHFAGSATEWFRVKERPAAIGPRRFYTLQLNYSGDD
ncbi:MAG: lamin tail domain-containing protein [Kiritimatiellae bacterium]|jgi:hypothetical protein|nr:lamin tail domain-containing protein [Kiritimatiellia bacterium]